MLENLSIGLDIATALSVIAAAVAFIWNSVLSRRKERNERRKEIIKSHVFKVAEKIIEESTTILKETKKIEYLVRDGVMTQNLDPWKDLVLQLPMSFRWLQPLDEVYSDGRFIQLSLEFEKELNEFMLYFEKLVSPENDEEWDFYEVMDKPNQVTIKYVTKLYQEAEDYFSEL
jgi:hypothetical protein